MMHSISISHEIGQMRKIFNIPTTCNMDLSLHTKKGTLWVSGSSNAHASPLMGLQTSIFFSLPKACSRSANKKVFIETASMRRPD